MNNFSKHTTENDNVDDWLIVFILYISGLSISSLSSSSQIIDAGGFDTDEHWRITSIFFEPVNVRTFVVIFGGSANNKR